MPTFNTAAYSGSHGLELLEQVMNGLDCATDCTFTPGNPFKRTVPKLKIAKGARPYRLQFDPVNSGEFSDREIMVHRGKKDFVIEGELYREKYLALAKQNKLDPDEVPYWDYHIMQEMKMLLAEINDDVAYLGVRDANGTDAVDITNGWGTIIAGLIAANTITPYTMGTITDANAAEKFKAFYQTLDAAFRKIDMKMYMSFENYDKYQNSIPANKNVVIVNHVENEPVMEKTYLIDTKKRVEIVPATWMGNSNRIILTPKENMLMDSGLPSDQPTIEFQKVLSAWQCRLNYLVGFQIADLDHLFVTEAA